MKKNLLNIAFLAITIIFVSCENDDNLNFTTTSPSFNILTPSSGSVLVLDSTNEDNPSLTVVWEDAINSSTYNIEFALSNTDFASPHIAGTTDTNTITWSVLELNTFLTETLGLTFNTAQDVDLRVVSSTNDITNAITLSVTPYGLDPLPRLAVPGNHQGWQPDETMTDYVPYIATTLDVGATNYEGYMWLDGEFKFVEPDADGIFAWGNTDWGEDGTFSGIMVSEGEINFPAQPAGYYFVQGDTGLGTYSIQSVNWGIIGAATPTGWGSDTDLVYNTTTKALEVDIDLTNGEAFKFRGNDTWGSFDLGTIDDDGFLTSGGDLVFDQPTGNYHVVLDLSNPRRYVLTITPN